MAERYEPVAGSCVTCGHVLEVGVKCQAYEYEQMQGREGRHGGYCWGGGFPRADEPEEKLVKAPPLRLRAR